MVLDDAVWNGLQFPRLGRVAWNGEIVGETQQVVSHIGVPGIQHRGVIDDKAVVIDFGCENRSGRGPQTVWIFLHRCGCTFDCHVDLLRVGRPQAQGRGAVWTDLRRDIAWWSGRGSRGRGGGGLGRREDRQAGSEQRCFQAGDDESLFHRESLSNRRAKDFRRQSHDKMRPETLVAARP